MIDVFILFSTLGILVLMIILVFKNLKIGPSELEK